MGDASLWREGDNRGMQPRNELRQRNQGAEEKAAETEREPDLALFDISISNIDCRYINTFEKYRYR